jgi:DNA-directed RNA polymerase specialized sigma24 family protein
VIEEYVTAPLDSDLYLQLEPLVNAIASQEWKNSHIFSIDDVAQAIWEHMMAEWRYYDGADEDLVKHMARRAARRYCQDQRTQYMYSTGAFLYTPAMVRRFLEEMVWCSPEDCKDVDARIDLSEAYAKLPKSQKAAVYRRYGLKEPLNGAGEQSAESRAVSAMTRKLNTGLRLHADVFEQHHMAKPEKESE